MGEALPSMSTSKVCVGGHPQSSAKGRAVCMQGKTEELPESVATQLRGTTMLRYIRTPAQPERSGSIYIPNTRDIRKVMPQE